MSGHVGFVVIRAALGQVFSEYFGFFCQSLHPLPPRSSSSIIILSRYIRKVATSVIVDSIPLHPKDPPWLDHLNNYCLPFSFTQVSYRVTLFEKTLGAAIFKLLTNLEVVAVNIKCYRSKNWAIIQAASLRFPTTSAWVRSQVGYVGFIMDWHWGKFSLYFCLPCQRSFH
jgi:hypothetical protein